ncbi:MAG TPA: hypothetical protein VFJ59_15985 [Pseudolabrys sp.]|nr:hypothetical protein [Pseudolabrys sp.]
MRSFGFFDAQLGTSSSQENSADVPLNSLMAKSSHLMAKFFKIEPINIELFEKAWAHYGVAMALWRKTYGSVE